MNANHSDREVDEHSGQATTGHEWDGIKELDTPLPRWWLYLFYATIAASVVYWVLMPAWPLANSYTRGLLNHSDRLVVAEEVKALQTAREPNFEKLMTLSHDEILADQELSRFALKAGESVFGDNCRTCHGAGGAGAKGFPSLADNVWIWGGTLEDIEHTLTVGVRSAHPETRFSQMPAYGRDGLLSAAQIDDVTEYVLSLSEAAEREKPNRPAAARGAVIYVEQCAACHGPTGDGSRELGAPALTDDIWIYAGSRAEVRKQIYLGRGGVMPNWNTRFDPATIRALSIYVWGLGGGEAKVEAIAEEPAPAPAPQPDALR